MSLRLGVAAAMATVLSTLAVMIVRAVIDPPLVPDIAAREAFLLQCVALGLAGGLVLQLAFRRQGLPSYAGGLGWGAGGFAAAVLAPLWVLPGLPPGELPLRDGGTLLFWLFTVAVTALGLWLVLAGRGNRRLFGLALLLAPSLLAPVSAWREQTGLVDPVGSLPGNALPGDALPGDALPDQPPILPGGPMEAAAGADGFLLLGLNLLFWLLLGVFSVLSARRIPQS